MIDGVFKSFKVRQYFSLKSKTPFALLANVVYRFECSRDVSTSYIGKTKRHLAIRVDEHLVSKKGQTAVHKHRQSCETCKHADIQNFSVIASGNSDLEIKVKEALLIKCDKPELNKQLFQNGSSFLLNVF